MMQKKILLLIAVCLCGVFSGVFVSAEEVVGGEQLREEIRQAQEVPLKQSDTCIVCGTSLDTHQGKAFELRGRRVAVGLKEFDTLLLNPEKYFSSLQPKGALFTEAAKRSCPRFSWLLFAVVMLGIVAGIGATAIIQVRRRITPETRPSHGFTKIPSTAQPSTCSKCGVMIHPSASECPACHNEIRPAYESEVRRSLPEEGE